MTSTLNRPRNALVRPRRVSLRGYGPDSAAGAIRDRVPFDANGSLRGYAATADDAHPYSHTGRMPAEDANTYREHSVAGRIAYVIVSYATPIAYALTDGTVIRPAARYSVTTSRHQSTTYTLV